MGYFGQSKRRLTKLTFAMSLLISQGIFYLVLHCLVDVCIASISGIFGFAGRICLVLFIAAILDSKRNVEGRGAG